MVSHPPEHPAIACTALPNHHPTESPRPDSHDLADPDKALHFSPAVPACRAQFHCKKQRLLCHRKRNQGSDPVQVERAGESGSLFFIGERFNPAHGAAGRMTGVWGTS